MFECWYIGWAGPDRVTVTWKLSWGQYWLHRDCRAVLNTHDQGPVYDPWLIGVWPLGC